MTYTRGSNRTGNINIYILYLQEEDCTMREAQRGQSLPIRQEDSNNATIESHGEAISRAQGDDLLHGRGLWFNSALATGRVALWRAHSIYDFAFMDVNIPVLPLNESNLPKDVIYSLSLSIYGKNCTHAMIFKSFLLKWNSDFRTISYKRMEIHHFAMKTT
ncbi:hypothetical protein ACJX0J_003930 [Zea mays]